MGMLVLPTDNRALSDALEQELRQGEMEANSHLTSWKIIDAYMHGLRHFRIMDRWQGDVSIAFENIQGEIDFRYDEISQMYLVEMGRYMKMNISPVVTKKHDTLDALRKSAVAHAALGALTQTIPLKKLKREALIPFLKYGTVGLQLYSTGDPSSPWRVEVVQPRELRGLPAFTTSEESRYGISRKRWVPLMWIREKLMEKYDIDISKEATLEQLEHRDVPWGSTPPNDQPYDASGPAGGAAGSIGVTPAVSEANRMATRTDQSKGWDLTNDGRGYVPMEELYIYADDKAYLSQFIIRVGRFVAYTEEYEEDAKILCPLQIARHTDTGRFFSRGFLAKLLPVNHSIEKLIQSLFKNIQEMDMFGTLFIPGESGINTRNWRTGPRPKVEKYNPDPMSPDAKPFAIQPSNTGLLPIKVAEFGMQLMKNLSGQGPLFQGEAPGRIDSAAGSGFVFNTGNISLGLPINSFADAWVGIYACILQRAKSEKTGMLKISVLTDAVAGIKYDPVQGTISLDENPLPNPWEVSVDIADRTARDPALRKQELMELYGRQLIDEVGFWIAAFEENLDFPGAPKEIWETWRKATWQIVVLFGDGETPGKIDVGQHTQNPNIQLRAVQRFMDKIEFSLASVEVRTLFENWKMELEMLAGKAYPDMLGAPEDIAQVQGSAGPPGPGGPQAPGGPQPLTEAMAALEGGGPA